MAKRGRKPSNVRKGYFYEEEEQAVLDYLKSDDAEEKNRIFTEKLQRPFTKMIESIIRRYKLYHPDETFEETFDKAFSFLVTKFDKFDTTQDRKAFSYYQTIVKNFLMGRLSKRQKALERNPSYSDVSNEFINNMKYTTQEDRGAEIAKATVSAIINKYKLMIESPNDYGLNDIELSICKALLNFFENWDYILTTSGSSKLNKSTAYFFLKESTGLDTNSLRKYMKKFKNDYLILKQGIIDE